MGLDMYLCAEKNCSGYAHSPAEEYVAYAAIKRFFGLSERWCNDKAPFGSACIAVAYWRKAWEIHDWFNKNVAGGKYENCQRITVYPEQLQQLVDLCKQVLEKPDVAAGDLPALTDFEDDEYKSYRNDLVNTVSQLEAVLSNPAFNGGWFVYRANW